MCCLCFLVIYVAFFFFKQKTAYEVRISDWSSDVCSSDLMPDIIAFKLETSAMPLAERLEDILDILECIAENPVPRGLQILRLPALLEALVLVDHRIKAKVHRTHVQ